MYAAGAGIGSFTTPTISSSHFFHHHRFSFSPVNCQYGPRRGRLKPALLSVGRWTHADQSQQNHHHASHYVITNTDIPLLLCIRVRRTSSPEQKPTADKLADSARIMPTTAAGRSQPVYDVATKTRRTARSALQRFYAPHISFSL